MRACGTVRLLKVATNPWCHATFLTLSLVGCQAPRTPEPAPPAIMAPAATSPGSIPAAPPAPQVDTDRIASVAEAEGRTLVTLPPRTDLQPGDTLHVLTGDRVIASAVVVESGPEGVRASVVALSDLRRPVHPGDRVGTIPLDQPTAVAPITAPATTTSSAATADASSASAAAHDPHSEPTPAAKSTASATRTTTDSTPKPEHGHDSHTAPATAETASAQPRATSDLTPEIRARLEAERAYWELSARILRLPSGGPELTALQQRLRTELAEMAP